MYTSNFQSWLAAGILEQGACGYLAKSPGSDSLVAALLAINDGKMVVAPRPRPLAAEGTWPGHEELLTEREAEVLSLISMGLSNDDIAGQLGLSINSIKSYIRSASRTIDVESRTQAVLWAGAHGLRTEPLPDAVAQTPTLAEVDQPAEDHGLSVAGN